VLIVGILLGVSTVLQQYQSDTKARDSLTSRNTLIAQALASHRVDTLIGGYARVVPTKLVAQQPIAILPLSTCTDASTLATSTVWQHDVYKRSFAYLLSLDAGDDYPDCSLQDIVRAYGSPNASVIIAGSFQKPKELLLYYDKGAHKSSPATPQTTTAPSTVVPITLDKLPYTSCQSATIMNIVAHQDDDILFMSPDLLHDIKDGHCIRTIYVTAGDAGTNQFYWQGREQGAEAAYNQMIGSSEIWVQRIVKVSDTVYVTVANPKGNSKISLLFLRLPDGNVRGEGFSTSNFEALSKLQAGIIPTMHSDDRASSYTSAQLVSTLSTLMATYKPNEIRTQSTSPGSNYVDHKDHNAVGMFTTQAYDAYAVGQPDTPLKFYKGYPIHGLAPNVGPEDLQQKQAAFYQYGRFDGAACQSDSSCSKTPYGSYLRRQYQASK
jgi:LmbE family N-acetylglucosaminyl deacetylase